MQNRVQPSASHGNTHFNEPALVLEGFSSIMQQYQKQHGFTLLEILLVVAAIGILAGIVILAVNPGKQLGDTRNAQRKVNVNTILIAVYQYSVDNNAAIPGGITAVTCAQSGTEICKTNANCTGYVDLGVLTANEKYLVTMPTDPTASSTNGTGYSIVKDGNNRITVCAPSAEQGATISVTR